jgi:hypothetical protein
VREEAFEQEHSVPIVQHHLAWECIVPLEMGLNGSFYISYLPNGRWACILLVRILKDAEMQGARCAFTFSRYGPLFRGLPLA